jgi:hypothetical protein
MDVGANQFESSAVVNVLQRASHDGNGRTPQQIDQGAPMPTTTDTPLDDLFIDDADFGYDAAAAYIRRLTGDENTPVTWQTFDDCKLKDHKKRPSLIRVLHGPLSQHYNQLKRLNDDGAGIYVTVNSTDFRGRRDENIVSIRAVWSDDDGGILDPNKMPLRPQLVVQTSPGKQQVYILTEDAPIEEHAAVIERMVKDHGCDPGAKGLARVLRVPGFYHMKVPTNPHRVEISHMTDDPPYPWKTVKLAFPPMINGHFKTRGQRINEAFSADPVYRHLEQEGRVRRVQKDGKVFIHCPFEDQHTMNGGDGETVYFVAHTNGYKHGHFKCLHGHCANRTRNDFLNAIGFKRSIPKEPYPGELEHKPNIRTDNNADPFDVLSGLSVKREYTDMLGAEEWMYPNLIIKNQVTAIIALSGGGKSTIMFNFICPWMLKDNHDLRIMFFDVDSPASDHQQMIETAESYGPRFEWINPLTHSQDETIIRQMLEQAVKLKRPMHNYLLIFDTLKKFCYLLSKEKVRDFFKLMRSLTSLGATVVLLGHANKYRMDGLLVPEGVGDVKNDTDALIILERIAAEGGMHVSSVVDHDKNAKVRGLYEPITFHIEQGTRVVTAVTDYVSPPNYTAGAKDQKMTDEEVVDLVSDFLRSRHGHISQSDVLKTLKAQVGYNRLFNILTAHSVHEDEAEIPGQIYYSVREHNKKAYSVVDG